MNTLGLILLGSAVHATVFAIGGALVYLALRRSSPAAGALAAGSCLAMIALVSLVAASPWRGFWTFDLSRRDMASAALAATDRLAGGLPPARAGTAGSNAPAPVGSSTPDRAIEPTLLSGSESADVESVMARLVGAFEAELGRGATPVPTRRLGWPAWLAVGFLLSVLAGVARLSLGIMAFRRLRAGSLPIADLALLEEIEIMRAELSCTRSIEARETTELATPATFGWRRPILLLPFDWRDWDPCDRRAVLAHELAHVRRGDFLTAMVAQVSLALHFYHPLAHWLTARLRLEQELAADDWGARLWGGKRLYLASLARLALSRDTPATIWPARAFLPSRGTFLRRIDMLRRTERVYPAALSLPARVVTVGLIAAMGLLIAGLRVSAGSSQSPLQETTGQITVQDKTAAADAPAFSKAFDLSYLPADTKILLAIRPGPLLDREDVKSLMTILRQGPLSGAATAIPLDQIEQFAAFWEGLPETPGPARGSPMFSGPTGFVVHTKIAQDWKARMEAIVGGYEEFLVEGQKCFRGVRNASTFACACTPDARTLVVTREDLIHEIVADRKAAAPIRAWDQALNKVAKAQAVLALDSRWLRRRMAQRSSSTPPQSTPDSGPSLEMISPLFDNTRSYAISIGAVPTIEVDLIAETANEADAKPVVDTLRAILTLGRNSVQRSAQNSDKIAAKPAFRSILPLSESLLSNAVVESSGPLVHMRAKSTIELGEILKSLAPEVEKARFAYHAAKSVNNLKHIGLAFHNYLQANGHFPAPVLYGGSRKSIPYSWRVAILPYIEQEPLYRQYNFEEAWDGPNNRKLIDKMPAVYSVRGLDGNPLSHSNTSYFVFVGETTALGGPKGGKYPDIGVNDILDGTSNTILAVERKADVPWTKPEDIPFDLMGPLPEIGGFSPESFHALIADGSVRTIQMSIHPVTLKALITRASGELIAPDSF